MIIKINMVISRMNKYLFLLSLIGFYFWSCEQEVESQYIDVKWISFIPGELQYCVYTQEYRNDLIDVYGIKDATGWVASELPQCDSFYERLSVYYFKDEGYIISSKDSLQEKINLIDANNIQYAPH